MSYYLDHAALDTLLGALHKEYRIFAPKRFPLEGRFSDTDIIRYAEYGKELSCWSEVELTERSTYAAKEVVNPLNQSIFYFTPEAYHESKECTKPILVFLRPCDIHSFSHQDKIYLENGGFVDSFYARVRQQLRFVLIECLTGFDTCFCVSFGCNQSDDYVMAVRQQPQGVSFFVKDESLKGYFTANSPCDFTPQFIQANQVQVVLPQIPDKETLNALKKHPFWEEYDRRCISCGSCTVCCSTCTCFTTRDIAYTQNAAMGERRRMNSSCQVKGFDEVAGGHSYRTSASARYRYKMLHKYHDFQARFQETHMCVGCGRCTSHCPAYISQTASIAKIKAAVEEITAQKGR